MIKPAEANRLRFEPFVNGRLTKEKAERLQTPDLRASGLGQANHGGCSMKHVTPASQKVLFKGLYLKAPAKHPLGRAC